MTRAEKRFGLLVSEQESRQDESLSQVAESLCVGAWLRGRPVIRFLSGREYKWYDLASLTKIIFTAPAVYAQLKSPREFSQDLSLTLPWLKSGHCMLNSVMAHQNGLKWWSPFFRQLGDPRGRAPEDVWSAFMPRFRRAVRRQIKAIRPGVRAVYSDYDFLLLGDWLTHRSTSNLAEIWDSLADQMGWRDIDFQARNRPTSGKRSDFAPTENCPWRGRLIQGEVHDPNAWALGGIATHAGLFGTLEGVAHYGLSLRKALRDECDWGPIAYPVLRQGLKRFGSRANGDWALGFSLPSQANASCGPKFSLKSVGHLGFTGTSLWYDPRADLLVIILSNRTYPSSQNVLIRKWRPILHNAVVRAAVES